MESCKKLEKRKKFFQRSKKVNDFINQMKQDEMMKEFTKMMIIWSNLKRIKG
jgi:hypothetical protein